MTTAYETVLLRPERVLSAVFDLLAPSRVVGVGRGDGSWLSVARRLGAEQAVGLEPAPRGLFDLALCLEAERFSVDGAGTVDLLCAMADVVLVPADYDALFAAHDFHPVDGMDDCVLYAHRTRLQRDPMLRRARRDGIERRASVPGPRGGE